jgi:hypothetical protein
MQLVPKLAGQSNRRDDAIDLPKEDQPSLRRSAVSS